MKRRNFLASCAATLAGLFGWKSTSANTIELWAGDTPVDRRVRYMAWFNPKSQRWEILSLENVVYEYGEIEYVMPVRVPTHAESQTHVDP